MLDLARLLAHSSLVSITKLVQYRLHKWTMNERLPAWPGSKICDQWFKVPRPITSRVLQIRPETSPIHVFTNSFTSAVLQGRHIDSLGRKGWVNEEKELPFM